MVKVWMFHVWQTALWYQHSVSTALLSITRVLQFPQVKRESKMK